MELIRLEAPAFETGQVERACALLERGAVGVMPTDTVYGLVALAGNRSAVARVFEIKGRPASKPVPVLVAGVEDASELTFAGGVKARRLMEAFWPGPLTLVLKSRPGVALPFQDPASLALRVPDCPFCIAVIERAGFVVAPSANQSGKPPPSRFGEADPELLGMVEFAVDGGTCPGGTESTVVGLTGGIEIIREGAIKRDAILAVALGGPPPASLPNAR